jgi:hypothetical protein
VTPREIGGPIAITRYNLYTAAAINGNVAPGGSTGDAIKAIDAVANDTLPLSMRIEWTELMFMQLRAGNTAMYVLHAGGRPRYDATKHASQLRLRPILMTSFAFIFGVVPLVLASGAGAEMRRSLGIAVFSGMLGVTLFGIFLTPIFFYVIQGLGESRLFRAELTQSVVSYTLVGLLGGAAGYLLALLHVGRLPWGPVVGACAGLLVVRAVRGLRQLTRSNGGPPSQGEQQS